MTTNPTTQPEQVLETELITKLIGQGFRQVAVMDEASMLANLKAQLEAFNGLATTDGECTKVLHHLNRTSGVFAKAKTLRDRMKLEKKGGETVYLEFFDSVNPTHLGGDDRQVHRAQLYGQDPDGAASVSILCHRGHRRTREASSGGKGQRLHLAHDGIGQDADFLQGGSDHHRPA